MCVVQRTRRPPLKAKMGSCSSRLGIGAGAGAAAAAAAAARRRLDRRRRASPAAAASAPFAPRRRAAARARVGGGARRADGRVRVEERGRPAHAAGDASRGARRARTDAQRGARVVRVRRVRGPLRVEREAAGRALLAPAERDDRELDERALLPPLPVLAPALAAQREERHALVVRARAEARADDARARRARDELVAGRHGLVAARVDEEAVGHGGRGRLLVVGQRAAPPHAEVRLLVRLERRAPLGALVERGAVAGGRAVDELVPVGQLVEVVAVHERDVDDVVGALVEQLLRLARELGGRGQPAHREEVDEPRRRLARHRKIWAPRRRWA